MEKKRPLPEKIEVRGRKTPQCRGAVSVRQNHSRTAGKQR